MDGTRAVRCQMSLPLLLRHGGRLMRPSCYIHPAAKMNARPDQITLYCLISAVWFVRNVGSSIPSVHV